MKTLFKLENIATTIGVAIAVGAIVALVILTIFHIIHGDVNVHAGL